MFYLSPSQRLSEEWKRSWGKKSKVRRHASVGSYFFDCFTVTFGGLMLKLYYMEGGGGLVVLPWRNFGRICAEV